MIVWNLALLMIFICMTDWTFLTFCMCLLLDVSLGDFFFFELHLSVVSIKLIFLFFVTKNVFMALLLKFLRFNCYYYYYISSYFFASLSACRFEFFSFFAVATAEYLTTWLKWQVLPQCPRHCYTVKQSKTKWQPWGQIRRLFCPSLKKKAKMW